MLKQWKSARPPIYFSVCFFYRCPMKKKIGSNYMLLVLLIAHTQTQHNLEWTFERGFQTRILICDIIAILVLIK